MHARATIAHYHPGTQEEATSILRDEMLPKAKELQGFKGALILNDAIMNTGIIITLWETEEDLEASGNYGEERAGFKPKSEQSTRELDRSQVRPQAS